MRCCRIVRLSYQTLFLSSFLSMMTAVLNSSSGSVIRGRKSKMKVLTKTLTASALTTALLASTSLFANTTANVQVQTSQPSVLQNLKHDVKHAAHATGETVEHGVDKTKAFSKEKWQDTKEFSAEKSAVVKDKAGDVKDSVAHNTKKSGHYIADKAKQGQQATKQKWQETKQAVSGQPKRADVNGQAQVELDTPVAKAKVGSSADATVGAK